MSNQTERDTFQNLGNALDRLEEALNQSLDNPLAVDGTIQRFEFCYELFWKALKQLLSSREAIQTSSPKQTLQQAYALGWLEEETLWLNMLQDRNLTSHTYNVTQALEIYQHIKNYYPALKKVYEILQNKFFPL